MRRFICLEGEYVSHQQYGALLPEGSGIRCKRTGLVLATRQQLVEVASGVYKEITPTWDRTTYADPETIGGIGGFIPVKYGFLLLYRSDDTPTHARSIALSYAGGYRAILVKSIKGSCIVPKPYWASVITNGTETTVDGYLAYSLADGEYACFYDSPSAPVLGANRIGFADRYPKEGVVEGVTLTIDLSLRLGGTGTVKIATGYGQTLDYNEGLGDGRIFVNPAEPRMRTIIGTGWGAIRLRGSVYVHSHWFPFAEGVTYLDDPLAGTWADPWDVYGIVGVFEDLEAETWGHIVEFCQHRTDYSRVNHGRFYKRMRADIINKIFEEWYGIYIHVDSRHFNYGRGGATVPFSNVLISDRWLSGVPTLPNWTSYGYNGAWGSISFASGSVWTYHDGYWAMRTAMSSDYGVRYAYGAFRKAIAPSRITALTPVVAGFGDFKWIHEYHKECEDIYLEAGEEWGYETYGRVGAVESYETSPPSPVLTTDASSIDEYFNWVARPPTGRLNLWAIGGSGKRLILTDLTEVKSNFTGKLPADPVAIIGTDKLPLLICRDASRDYLCGFDRFCVWLKKAESIGSFGSACWLLGRGKTAIGYGSATKLYGAEDDPPIVDHKTLPYKPISMDTRNHKDIILGGYNFLHYYSETDALTDLSAQVPSGSIVTSCLYSRALGRWFFGCDNGTIKSSVDLTTWTDHTADAGFSKIGQILDNPANGYIVVVGIGIDGYTRVKTFNGVVWVDRTVFLAMDTIYSCACAVDTGYMLFGGANGVVKGTSDFITVTDYTTHVGFGTGVNVTAIGFV